MRWFSSLCDVESDNAVVGSSGTDIALVDSVDSVTAVESVRNV